jgi:hypothetical protein
MSEDLPMTILRWSCDHASPDFLPFPDTSSEAASTMLNTAAIAAIRNV